MSVPARVKTGKLSAEQQGLIVKWLALVKYVMRKRPSCWNLLDANEAYSVGTDALIRAAQLFDPTNGSAFNTYAVASIYRQLWRENERAGVIRRKSGAKYGDPSVRYDPIEPNRLAARKTSNEEAADARELVVLALTCLPRRYKAVVEMHLGGATLKEMGEALGITREGARLVKNRALAKLKARLIDLSERG